MQDDTAPPSRQVDPSRQFDPTRESDPSWEFDAALDAGGLKCPLPVLKARKALLALRPGQRLRVTATDPLAAIDLPHFCAESGHRLVATATQGTRLLFLVERGETAG
jgi:tRNA 2-thiouridine synthesizing protein A